LFLILLFCNVVGLLFLLNVEYLAMVFIIVYIGAIAVLFLFVVMMLNLRLIDQSDIAWQQIILGVMVSGIFLFEMVFLYSKYKSSLAVSELFAPSSLSLLADSSVYLQSNYVDWVSFVESNDNIHVIGQVMYTYYFISFLLSSVILLVAMVGAIILTLPDQIVYKRQFIFQQIGRQVAVSLLK
jgi:NADH:ubiquinone oxidoreductase subunit 6 (subunit J)